MKKGNHKRYCINKKKITKYYKQLYANQVDSLEEMDNILETYSPPKVNQEEIDLLDRPITRSEIEYVKKKTLPTKNSPGPGDFTGKFYQILPNIPILLKLFQKVEEETLQKSFYEATSS